MKALFSLESCLNYTFIDQKLLRQALTHRSFSHINNERLEFLGDGILDAVIAKMLYNTFKLNEGELSRLRSYLVRQDTLHQVALELQLGSYLYMGEGELKSGGFKRPSILADAFEAVLGAIWLDGGYEAVEVLITQLFTQRIQGLNPREGKDHKSQLQEWLQAKKIALPIYEVIATQGEAHEQHFIVCCTVQSLAISAQGTGSSRRLAEQNAAEQVYKQIAISS